MNRFDILKYYSNPDVQKVLMDVAKDREVVGRFDDGRFLHRPDTLLYTKDLMERVNKGISTFHCSVEKWTHPMRLSAELNPSDLDKMRKGFDLIIDMDSKVKLEHAAITAEVVCEFLKELGIKPTVKFSGSRGFHVGVAGNAFPDSIDFKKMTTRYPEVPQSIAMFIREQIKDRLLDRFVEFEGGVAALVKDLPSVSELSPYAFVDIEKDWGNRHLFRMPYSLHKKFWLVSLPIEVKDLRSFDMNMAKPENVNFKSKFLENKDGEGTELLLQALDWTAKHKKEEVIKSVERRKGNTFTTPIPEEFFPPCVQTILNGITDGRKRSLFTILSFLRSVNWTDEMIQARIQKWNEDNSNPLTDRTINTQLKWHFRQNRSLLPANCESDMFYKSMGICKRTKYCGKNPVNYAFKTYILSLKKLKNAKKVKK
ncbi:MAG: hypothetical protein GOV02_04175 [Candidatus Aenigmarchaeota archaeon]|nr:hypothetical protein [Candidatus Aenigmarchaeota archaeon]